MKVQIIILTITFLIPYIRLSGRGGFGRGRGRGGDRGRGRGRGRGGKDEKETWTPVTKLGRLVKDRKIQSIEQIYLFSLPLK
ncbi:hypothetical protein BGZ68_009985, partial [Mortierella alpina]